MNRWGEACGSLELQAEQASDQQTSQRRTALPPHRLLWWSFSRSFHQALLQPTRAHSTECLPILTCPEQLERRERKMGSYLLNSRLPVVVGIRVGPAASHQVRCRLVSFTCIPCKRAAAPGIRAAVAVFSATSGPDERL